MVNEVKPIYKSKTFWFSAFYPVLLGFEPTLREFASKNPGWVSFLVSLVFILLRFFTSQPISLRKVSSSEKNEGVVFVATDHQGR